MRSTVLALVLAVVAGPALAAEGAAVFKQNCAKCHGETGMADTPISKALKVPVLAGNEKIAGMSTDDLHKAFKANPKHSTVKASDDEISAALDYVKGLAAKK
jgi:mono/diheme cytochrome c family protein